MSEAPRTSDGLLVDQALALIGSAVVLLGWHSTYAGSGWWIAGVTASVIAAMVAVVVRDARGGSEIVGLVLLLGYLVVAGPLARGTLAVDGLSTITDGLTGTGEVWGMLLTTHPPVDSTGAALLPPILTGLVSAGFATSISLGSRRPAAPLIPVVLSLAVVLLVGQHDSASVLGLGAGTGVLAIGWMRVRAVRLEDEQLERDPSRARRAVISAVVLGGCAATAFSIVGDDVDSGRFVLRDEVRPYAVSRLRTPLDEFRDLVLSERELLRVEGLPAGYRLRFAGLDEYDGGSWSAGNDTDAARSDDRFLHVSSKIENPARGGERLVTIAATKYWDRPWVPTVGAVQSFSFADAGQRDDLLYNPATGTALLPDGLGRDEPYSFTAVDTDRIADRQMQESELFDEDLYEQLPMLDQVINYWISGSYTPMDAVFKVASGIRKVGRYSHGDDPQERAVIGGHDLTRITDGFLLATPSVGDEEQYAAAMALLANRMRIPARVVVGAIVPKGGVVRGSDVSAWVELRAEDGTWRTLPTDVFMGRRPPDRLDAALPTTRDFSAPDDTTPDRPQSRRDAADEPRDDVTRDVGATRPWWLLSLPAVLVAAAVVPLIKWWRRRRRLGARRVSTRYAGAWDELVDHALDLGVDVPRSSARPAQAAVLEGTMALALEADRQIYSHDPLDEHEAEEFWELVRAELRALDTTTTRRRRVLARFSLRSLRRPAARPGSPCRG